MGVVGPEAVAVRFKLGVLELSDIEQTMRMDVNCFFYYKPVEPVKVDGQAHVRFENIEKPEWHPNFDFADEIAEVLCTDESYWLDTKTGLVFGRLNLIPHIQERFDHHPFPFDRQILDIQCMMNNCLLEKWDLHNPTDFPVEMSLGDPEWISQCELNAEADAWNLHNLKTHCINDEDMKSAIVHFQIFLERVPDYYFFNIGMVYYVIILLKCVLIVFPYTESRFDYAMTLALTTVAFKFISSGMVPPTSYLTYLDKFMLYGLFLLSVRFLADMVIQLTMLQYLPFGDEGTRGECSEANELPSGITPCTVDIGVTIILATLWTIGCAAFGLFVACPNLVRPKWKKLDSMQGASESKSLETEVCGNSDWIVTKHKIDYNDLQDASMGIQVAVASHDHSH